MVSVMPTSGKLAEEFVRQWLTRHGAWLSGDVLWRALGFGSRRSFQRAAARGQIGVKLYPSHPGPGRRARTKEVAEWLWQELEQRRRGTQ